MQSRTSCKYCRSSCTFSRRQRCRRRSLTSRSSGTKTGRSLRGHRLRTACTGWLRRTASRNTPSLSRTSSPLDCFRTRQRRHCTRSCSSPNPASSDTVATPAAVATTAVATATAARGSAAAARGATAQLSRNWHCPRSKLCRLVKYQRPCCVW